MAMGSSSPAGSGAVVEGTEVADADATCRTCTHHPTDARLDPPVSRDRVGGRAGVPGPGVDRAAAARPRTTAGGSAMSDPEVLVKERLATLLDELDPKTADPIELRGR